MNIAPYLYTFCALFRQVSHLTVSNNHIKVTCLDCSFTVPSRGNAYPYTDATMFAQQATAPYLDAGQQQQNFTAVTAPGAVTSGQTYLQVTPAGTAMQAQRHPITHTTRASPATVSKLRLGKSHFKAVSINNISFRG